MKKIIISIVAALLLVGSGVLFFNLGHRASNQHKKGQPLSQIEIAKKDLAQYNYDSALTALKRQKSNAASQLRQQIKSQQKNLISWNQPDQFKHLFFHSLIVDPQKAFKSKSAQGYADYMITIPEFNKILDQLYRNGYVLVGLHNIAQSKVVDGKTKMAMNTIELPKGKKPLILSQDDVSYYKYMKGDGFAKDLFVDKNGDIKNHYVDGGKKQVGNYDMLPIVDQFVEKHPDFSYHGDKGTIALTGYNGVLGYRTSISESSEKDASQIKSASVKAKKVATAIKKDGWTFASHSWGHINMKEDSLATIKRDNTLWKQEVEPIIGKTDIFIDPFGADVGGVEAYTLSNDKFAYMSQQGFKIFCNVDASRASWGQLGDNFYRNARINVDGIRFASTLDGSNTMLNQFFNTKQVVDQQNRKMVKK
jgi:peptidoglycan/xylan/chitin deacetylase (PgdA/CDA1 family)